MSYPHPTGDQGGYYPAPPQDHPQATLAMILGILSLVMCGLLGPFAWVIGGRAVKEIDASGGRIQGRGQAQAGRILGIIATALLALGLLALVAFVVFAIGFGTSG